MSHAIIDPSPSAPSPSETKPTTFGLGGASKGKRLAATWAIPPIVTRTPRMRGKKPICIPGPRMEELGAKRTRPALGCGLPPYGVSPWTGYSLISSSVGKCPNGVRVKEVGRQGGSFEFGHSIAERGLVSTTVGGSLCGAQTRFYIAWTRSRRSARSVASQHGLLT
jgi:hypothetical protein